MTGTINANETLNGGVEAIPTLSGTLSGNTTSSYNSLSDKPIINGTTLEGGVDRSLVEDVKVNGVSVVTDYVAEIENSAEGISYDNTSSTGVQATNVQDALDEAFQRTMDIGTWFTDVVAENYNYIKHYTVGDYVFHYPSSGVIKLYRCIENTSGFWDISKWEEVKLSNEVSDEVTLREELESATKVYGTPKNLPQPIATFTDGANLPMPSLKVSIEPVQDLHGYDAPWVGGAGKNKVDGGTLTPSAKNTNYVISPTLTTGDYVLSFDVSNLAWNNLNNTGFAWTNDSNNTRKELLSHSIKRVSDNAYLKDLTQPVTGRFYGVFSNVEVASLVIACRNNTYMNFTSGTITNIQLESGSTPTSYAPYSNICPISGWTEANVNVCGFNMWDEEWEVGLIDHTTGNNTTGNGICSKNYISIKANTNYYAHISTWYRIAFFDDNYIYISGEQSSSNIFTTPTNAKYMKFSTNALYGTTYNNDISINYPSTDTEYHAYNGQTYTIDLNGTRYGGKLDVVSGVLTVDRAIIDLGTLDWSYTSSSGRSLFTSNNITDYKHTGSNEIPVNAICECFENVSMNTTFANGQMGMDGDETNHRTVICDNRYSSASDFKTAMNGVQLVYELATPLTIQLTPTSIKSLEGVNNVWGDCGQIKDLKYVRNLNITINDLISRVEALEG